MRDGKTTTLPSVLREYDDKNVAKENHEEAEEKKKQPPQKEDKQRHKKSSSPDQKSSHPTPKHQRSPSHRVPSAGEQRRSARQKKVEDERLEQVADTWDQAKAEVLRERHDQLKEKLVLQHALIRAQDKRAQLIRQEEEEAKVKKRDEDKQKKQQQVSALQNHFKQSLENDRKSKRRTPSVSSDQKDGQLSDRDLDTETSSFVSGSEESPRVRRDRGKKPHGYLPSDTYQPATSPMKELEGEDEEAEDSAPVKDRAPDGVVTPADLSSVPWHHAQLYKMYGRNADYYIHPKMQPEKKKVINPTLKSQKGHLGASHIWTTLRSDSLAKLLQTDRKFPMELKEAFGSHVRDAITKHKKPVSRNFTETDDVPDLKRLLDQSLLRHIRTLRHKAELMYRSSQTNNDRTKILLFNNPMPDVNEGDDGISKYLPSWDDAASESSEASYMKWIHSKRDDNSPFYEGEESDHEGAGDNNENVAPADHKRRHPISVLSPVGSDVSEGMQNIWHSIMMRQRPRREPRYHFLTEEEARTEGAFLEKLGLEKDRIDRGRTDLLPQIYGQDRDTRQSLPSIKSQSAHTGNARHSVTGLPQSRRASAQNSSHSARFFESSWQPLSMHALVEYKQQMAAEGDGEFMQGRPRMWNTATTGGTDE